MLVLTRRSGESITVGDVIRITVLEVHGHQVRLGIEAPQEIPVHREEVYRRIREENYKAAQAMKRGLNGFMDSWRTRISLYELNR